MFVGNNSVKLEKLEKNRIKIFRFIMNPLFYLEKVYTSKTIKFNNFSHNNRRYFCENIRYTNLIY